MVQSDREIIRLAHFVFQSLVNVTFQAPHSKMTLMPLFPKRNTISLSHPLRLIESIKRAPEVY